MRLFGLFALASVSGAAVLMLHGGCNTYSEDLLAEGGAGTGAADTTSSSSNQGGDNEGGGQSACSDPSDCPGMDGECGTRTCEDGLCGVEATAAGTPIAAQTAGDCQTIVCDGDGDTDIEPDDADVEDDNQSCTTDTCSGGSPAHTPLPEGSSCTGPDGAKTCNADGVCVECVDGTDCASGACTQSFTCAPASCSDNVENNGESDIDCGGTQCPKCLEGFDCNGPNDCLGGICTGGTCQPSCTDMTTNGDETDVDCGGDCGPCAVGLECSVAADCMSGVCAGTCGEYQLRFSELWPQGPGGGTDDFIEIYNPLNVPVRLPLSGAISKLEIVTRSDMSANYSVKWTSNGQTIPAHGHLLLAGSGYSRSVPADETLSAGITDKVSVVIRRGATVLDAVCLHCGGSPFDASYTCEGTPFAYTGCTNNTDRSIERDPGGAAGNGSDTNDNTADFTLITPAAPQNLQSAPTP